MIWSKKPACTKQGEREQKKNFVLFLVFSHEDWVRVGSWKRVGKNEAWFVSSTCLKLYPVKITSKSLLTCATSKVSFANVRTDKVYHLWAWELDLWMDEVVQFVAELLGQGGGREGRGRDTPSLIWNRSFLWGLADPNYVMVNLRGKDVVDLQPQHIEWYDCEKGGKLDW